MKLKLLISLLIFPLSVLAQSTPLPLIPLPQKVESGNGQFIVNKKLTYYTDAYKGDSIAQVFNDFAENLQNASALRVRKAKAAKAMLKLCRDASLGGEEYSLEISAKGIVVKASRPAGFFYALQTLLQTSSPRDGLGAGVQLSFPYLRISDAPRFAWRGFMLDESRHFFGKEAVKRVLDVMARYKMNRFHWHLTDDQGWRVEIAKYPRLTTAGAWRASKTLEWGDYKADGQRYGGFYTREDIGEIVDYAAARFIDIVPEIDIPGHSQAAVAAYPELLACDPERPHEVWISQGISDDVINVAKPQAVEFAKDVIDEISELFPFGYIHLGGDECPTDKWQRSAECRQRLKEIGSTDFRDLQLDFYRKLQQHISQKPARLQRKLIFWNEVLYGNTSLLRLDFTVMAWVGADRAARAAAEKGLRTILSPQIPYYINRRQSKLPDEPRTQGQGTETLEAVYSYVPMKDVAPVLQKSYMGVQANFWSEWVEDAPTLEYLILPRLAAVAEAAWTPQPLRSYAGFVERLQGEKIYYKAHSLSYGRHAFEK